ncbi:hypothetical protein EXS56_03005 [Candidatus Kaiserbacteria bacterium]|nr:hypothetical protein [Candidatus Kaiserbacteria bacterium]
MVDITKQDVAELQKQITDKREALRVFRFGGAGSRTRDVRAGRTLRQEIARALTELRARHLSAAKAEIASKAKKA